jgi:hypothetical protein
MEDALVAAACALDDNGRVAIGFLYPDKFRGNLIQRLVPGYWFEKAFSPFPATSQRIFQTVRRVDSLAVGPSPQARPQLRFFAVISLKADNLAISDMSPQNAATAAIMTATGTYYSVAACGRLLPLFSQLLPHIGIVQFFENIHCITILLKKAF